MKTKHKITAIAFIVAASMSMGAMAGKGGGKGSGQPEPVEPQEAWSSATVNDAQVSIGNEVVNVGTTNNAVVSDSLNDGTGNAGVNVVAGDTNQQANALAISTSAADADFVFGAASSVGVLQVNAHNVLDNQNVTNNATLFQSGNNAAGNLGLNLGAGAFNQQKNDAAIANVEDAAHAEASVAVLQFAVAGETVNGVDSHMGYVPNGKGHGKDRKPTKNLDVENNATLVSSLNGYSGNIGVNIAAGGANQQSNTLSIAAACGGCPQ